MENAFTRTANRLNSGSSREDWIGEAAYGRGRVAGPSGLGPTPTVATITLVNVLMTETLLLPLFDSYTKEPSAVTPGRTGKLPTNTVETAIVAVLTTEMLLLFSLPV